MARLTKLSVLDYLGLISWYGVCLVIGAILIKWYAESWSFAPVIHAISDALIVAGVIGIVVELNSLNRLIDYVGEDVAHRVTAAHLPAALRGQIWQIVNSYLVCEDYQRAYRLHHLPKGVMSVESTTTYKVVNYGPSDVEYSPMSADERIHKPEFLSVEYRLASGHGHAFDMSQLEKYTSSRPGSKACHVDGLPKVTLRPKSQVPGEFCSVTWRNTAVMPVDYSDITSFGGPTIDPAIRLDEKPSDIDFFSGGDGVEQLGDRWVFKRPFIRDQHVRVWWYRR